MKICVTGSNGFVGAALLKALTARGHEVVAVARSGPKKFNELGSVEWLKCDLEESTPSLRQLAGVDAVVHLAGRSHIIREQDPDPLSAFRRTNVDATQRFAKVAADAEVGRFVLASTIGVHGSALATGQPVTEASPVGPLEPYAVSKLEAEEALWEVTRSSAMDPVVLRPTLVAGYGAPGNLQRLGRLINRGLPVPVPRRGNERSFVSLTNLTELILTALVDPAASGETFVVAESKWPSTRQVMDLIGEGLGRPARTVPLPGPLIRTMAKGAGKSALYDKVFGDLRVDADKARSQLNWSPEESLEEALRDVGRGIRS